MINLVENKQPANVARSDPEVQVGRALRRLRLSRGWSQEQVATYMQNFGYDFHQTMIAKIEAAQRPLRVRELADFAALYGVEINELIYPRNGSLAKIDEELAEVEAHCVVIRQKVSASAQALRQARAMLDGAQAAYTAGSSELAMLEERLEFLRRERTKFALWSDNEAAFSDDSASDTKPDPLAAETPADFIEALRQYRAWAGSPSWNAMANLTGQALAPSTMHNAMQDDALPSLDAVRAIIIGCGGDEDDLRNFATAWRRLSALM
jgi:transcriptional regulator with XRE-family HTH domain